MSCNFDYRKTGAMKLRYNAYNKSLYAFLKRIDIECPKCLNMAIVNAEDQLNIRLTCVHCGYFRLHKNDFPRISYLGANIDPYFLLPLWYQARFGNNVLWAYNKEHLDLIEKHVAAELRERHTSENSNSSLGSRLPGWLTSAKNRKYILKKINKLKEKSLPNAG